MSETVYKSAEGRTIVEESYRKLLASAAPVPFQQHFVATVHGKTHVLQFGDSGKAPLILLHGSMSNSASWLGIIPLFLDHFSVFCVDILGEPGLSETNRMRLHSDKPAQWLSAVLDGLAIPRCSFLGMSLGSWYALNFAINEPDRVAALSLITTGGIAPQHRNFIFKALFCMMLGQRGQKMLNRLIYHKTAMPPQLLEIQAVVSANFKPVTEQIPLFTDGQLQKLHMPIQYFGGDHDAILDTARTAERLRKLTPQAEIHVLNDTGHLIIDQFDVVRDFLAKTSLEPI